MYEFLQLFAEEAAATTGATPAVTAPGGKNPLADVKYGIQDDASAADVAQNTRAENTVDRNAEFEKMIKGDYKDLYDARVQEIVKSRLKGAKDTEAKYNAVAPLLERLGKKYGVKGTDPQAIINAIEDDDAFYEKEAMEKGVTVEQLKSYRKATRENEELRRQIEEHDIKDAAEKQYAEWMGASEKLKQRYPDFDLDRELQNKQFTDLLRSNVDMESAYVVIHKDEIIPAAMKFATQEATKKVADTIMANKSRPQENGNNAQSAANVKQDVRQLTKADREEIYRRVLNGEKIRF